MRLTIERKVCGGVFAVAIIALGVDRLILGGAGGPASAGAAEVLTAVEIAVNTPTKPAPGAAVMGVPVAKQLASLAVAAELLDGFAAPDRWREAMARAEAAAAVDAPASAAKPVEAADPAIAKFFKHQLTAVLSEQGQPTKALVKASFDDARRSGSRLLAIGDDLDGFKLIHLGTSSATFLDPAGKTPVELAIPVAGER